MSAVTAVAAPGERLKELPRGLPAWTYTHPGLTPLEHERIHLRSWQIVCHQNQIREPGDYVVLDIGPDSVFVVRGKDRQIRGFHNVCRHRGSRLVDGEGHCNRTVACPYHGWSYGFDGALIGVTVGESLPGLDKARFSLNPVRTEILFGFVFACIAGDPPPLAESWAGFAEEIAPYRLEEMVPLGPIYFEYWDVDWKLAMDNYLDSYHVPFGHPGLARMFTPDYDEITILPSGVAAGISHMKDRLSPKWSEREYQKRVAGTVEHLPEDKRRAWRFYSMLPNLGIDIFPDQIDFFQILPNGPGKCIIRACNFGLPDDRREMKLVRYLNGRINRQVQREDEFLCARAQRGMTSSSYEPGPLSEHEHCMIDFHNLIRERIPATREPRPPAVLA
jgi:phenylpropionate dioxygenase-like ring-hydroxylating dioxygenase large terminal subunit